MAKQKYGLFGWPVKHSVSPPMQEAGFQAVGIDASYELFEVPPEGLADKVAELKEEGYRGWNITVPHKTAMMDLVDEIEPTAALAKSVNTVVNNDGYLSAYSTDGYGLEMSVKRSFGVGLAGNHFLFWGTGGAAKATAGYFAGQGARRITLVNRTVAKAEALAEIINQVAPDCDVKVLGTDQTDALKGLLEDVAVLIQSTSIGLHADDPLSLPEELLVPGLQIVDMIYRPNKLTEIAHERGCKLANGRDMLLYQGVRSFEIWTGIPEGPADAMGRALDKALYG